MAGSLIKIAETTVSSAVSSVTLTGIDTTYDVYMIKINKLEVDTDNADLKLRFTESGTPNTTANYDSASKVLISTTFTNNSETNQTSADFSVNLGTGTGEQFNAILYIFNANNSSEYTFYTTENTAYDYVPRLIGKQGGGVMTVQSQVDGVQIIGDGTDIDNGKFSLYGLKK